MKIGTDGTLLGAVGANLALSSKARRILDIGTGTGLIALMVAQKLEGTDARIAAVEIDVASAAEARDNFSDSPFAVHLSLHCGDVLDYTPEVPFDLILSNPPFFTATHAAPDARRTQARHIGGLSPRSLFAKASSILAPEGQILVIYPVNMSEDFEGAAAGSGLFLREKNLIRTAPGKAPKRAISCFSRTKGPYSESLLSIRDDSGAYSSAYATLLSPYLTIF